MTQVHENMHQLPGGYVVERGPVRKTAIATKELFDSGVLASHYRLSKKTVEEKSFTDDKGVVHAKSREITIPGSPDAMGKPIMEGEEFTYVDWKAPVESWPWKVFKDTPYKNEQGVEVPYMEQVGEYEKLEDAIASCK